MLPHSSPQGCASSMPRAACSDSHMQALLAHLARGSRPPRGPEARLAAQLGVAAGFLEQLTLELCVKNKAELPARRERELLCVQL